ncbi:MAG TPA: amino acid racemase [Terriglobales bacterium]|nr:amino acid racemase [Terriglobales bacterium]
MTKHIGIVGCSAEGAALCYRTICEEGEQFFGKHGHPEITLHTIALRHWMEHIDRGDWQAVAALMLESARKLAHAGADFLICPDNTIHQAMPFVLPKSPLPWLHIAEVVAEEAVTRGYKRLALTGTRYLVDSDVYPEKLSDRGLEYRRPTPKERDEINCIIFDELVRAKFLPVSVASFQKIITRLAEEEGCDAVILGCTEIPLIITPQNSPIPPLDSTRLLARAALRDAES